MRLLASIACPLAPSNLLRHLWVLAALAWATFGAAADCQQWILATPPYKQAHDCSLTWYSDADASEWRMLLGPYASREQCETALSAIRGRASRPLDLERQHKQWEDYWKAIPWWKHALDRLAVWFWLGPNPERDERCLLVRQHDGWQQARCLPRSPPAATPNNP